MKKLWNRDQYVAAFQEKQNKDEAKRMEAYMKNLFPFLGIRSPERNEITRDYFSAFQLPKDEELLDETWEIYILPEREFQYAAITLLSKKIKNLEVKHLGFIEQLITEKSWWDSIDSIAPSIVGSIVKNNRSEGEEIMKQWSASKNMWLNRSAILHQLKYKENTNEELLKEIIRSHIDSQEFFIQKSIGWVLREYAKTNSDFVKQFVSTHELKPLSKREALKHL
ncbi:MAG: DNA alkylation repair protein [Paenisporosarcina sp.]